MNAPLFVDVAELLMEHELQPSQLPKTAELVVALEAHDSDYEFSQEPDPKATNNSGDKSGKYASEDDAKVWQEAMEKYVSDRNNQHQKNHPGADILCTPRTADNELAQRAARAGHLNRDTVPENGIQSRQYCKLTAIVDSKNRGWIRNELKRFMDDLQRLAEESLAKPVSVASEPGGNTDFEDGG